MIQEKQRGQQRWLGPGRASVLAGALAVSALFPADVAAEDDPTIAPHTALSADGRRATDGRRSLSASQVSDLDSAGHVVTVSGTGFDENKGIYVAVCAIPPRNHAPTPCGGGEDRDGGAGASGWVSSNPPSYAEGLTEPYGPGGSFSVSFSVRATITDTVDCRIVACAIVTRNDHTRSGDRSQDLFLPVSFAAPGEPVTPTPTTIPPPSTTAPTTTTTTVASARETTREADGLAVTDGTRRLSVSAADALDPAGATVEVRGQGYVPDRGVLVALCAVGAEGGVLGPCTGGSAGASAWISSDPPDYARDLAVPYDDGGAFAATLTVPAVIDAEADCRTTSCVIATRADDADPDDRSQELTIPVSFASESPTSAAPEREPRDRDVPATTLVTAAQADRGGIGPGVIVATVVVVMAVGAVVTAVVRRRRWRAEPAR